MFRVEFRDYEWDGFWTAKHDVPWLAKDVEIIICGEEESQLPKEKRDQIESICNLPLPIRGRLEQFLYREYQSKIFDTRCGGLEVTPFVSTKDEIWTVLSEPGIGIPVVERITPEEYFWVTFSCLWDDEHGLGIKFDQNCNPVGVGGGSDFI